MRFQSTLTLQRPLPEFSAEVIREERSQCRVPCDVAMHAGPIHRAFIEALPEAWRADPDVEIFSRLLWLKPGWYPIALGYHLDWGSSPGCVETLMANFGGCSYTEFVDDTFDLPDDGDRRTWGHRVEAMVERGELRTARLPANTLARFDNASWHRAMPAETEGWRILVRAIRGLDPAHQHNGAGTFTTVRNTYRPTSPEERRRHAPYRA